MVGYTGNIFFCFFFCPSVRLFPAKAAHSTTDKPRPKRLVRRTCLHRWLGQLVHTHTHSQRESHRRAACWSLCLACNMFQIKKKTTNLFPSFSFFFFPIALLFFFSSSSSFLIIYLFVCFVFHSVYTPSSSKDMVDIYVCVFVQELERERDPPERLKTCPQRYTTGKKRKKTRRRQSEIFVSWIFGVWCAPACLLDLYTLYAYRRETI